MNQNLFSENYAELYEKIREIDIPDQRYFESMSWNEGLSIWDNEKKWQTLLEEMDILSNADSRGDIDDIKTYNIIYNTTPNNVKNLFHPVLQITYRNLKTFIATYPALSYALITDNLTYQLGVAGDHPIIINQLVKWSSKNRVSKLNIPTLDLWLENGGCFATAWINYATTDTTIKILLDECKLSEKYLSITDSAVVHKNSQLLNLLYKRLNLEEKANILSSIVNLDVIEAFQDLVKNLISTKVYAYIITSSFISSIRFGAEKIFNYIISHNQINVIIGEDFKSPKTEVEFYDMGNGATSVRRKYIEEKDIEYNVITHTINVKYKLIHDALYQSKNISAVILALNKITPISRFNALDKEDLIYSRIHNQDWPGLKMLIELGMDLTKNIVHMYGDSKRSVLVYILNKENMPNDIKEYVMNRYDIDRLALLCACAKNRKKAATYLINSSNFNNVELCGVLRYGCTEINRLIMDKLGLKYDNIEPCDTFRLKQ